MEIGENMKLFEHKIIAVAIVFVSLFATVGPVFAESVYIQNSVSSYSNSGGQGEDGEDGKDGEDGEDGQDGRSGSDGQTIISGNGKASVSIKTTVNGETIVDINESNSASGTTSKDKEATTSPQLSESERTNILRLLDQIRLILISYVSQLFN